MRAGRAALLAEKLPSLRLVPDAPIADLKSVFVKPVERIALEIGFGSGEHPAGLLRVDPTLGLIGCEVFVNGVARFVAHLEDDGTGDRARVCDDDARGLLRHLPAASLDIVFLPFPDPWPKARHEKRRFLQTETLDLLAAALRDGGELRMASDDPAMQEWMLRLTPPHPAFEWTARSASDWKMRPSDEPESRYEAKAIAAGRPPIYLRFLRRPRAACA